MGNKVTVGIPVYNGIATLRRAVESVLAQTHHDLLVHISDNASTDGTSDLARALAAQDSRLQVTVHAQGIGISGNFGFLLEQAGTEYFMWLAADDALAPRYVERTLAALEGDRDAVCCASQVMFVRANGTTRRAEGTYALVGDPVVNLAAYLSRPRDNSRVFGLYRTEALKASFPPRYFHAYDWAIAAGTLLRGKHLEIAEPLMVRDLTPDSAYIAAIERDNPTMLGRLFPVLPLTADLVLRQRIPLRWPVIKALLKLNLEMHAYHAELRQPRYGEPLTRLLHRHVLWRLETAPTAPPLAANPSLVRPAL